MTHNLVPNTVGSQIRTVFFDRLVN
uniref:Uncharacterized protein n=1 Tax=Anguilla anguilla TaxID=7936 RepID=A0A0E9U0Z9_ANGAN